MLFAGSGFPGGFSLFGFPGDHLLRSLFPGGFLTSNSLYTKYHNTPKQAVEELFNTLPSQGNILRLKEAVKFKENDKLSDYQKDEFFNQLKKKNFKVKAKKERTHGDYKNVTCDITLPDGSTVEKKFRVIKEDDVWKTEIGFSEIRDAIFK